MKKKHILLVAILFLALAARLYRLGINPYGFFCDEAGIGYNAYQILTTGKDEYGESFPIFFRSFGDYKNPVQIYSTVPFVWLFGLNEFSVRAASGIWGILGIWGIYLMAGELFGGQKRGERMGLLAAFFLAISPWHIQFSRVTMEGLTPFVFFSEMGVYFWLKSKRGIARIYSAVIFMILAMYSYFPARIFIPALNLGLILMEFKTLIRRKNMVLTSGVLGFLLLVPMLSHMQGEGKSRWRQVSIFSSPPKDESVWKHIGINYARHFSADFLFLKGDIEMPGQLITRHSIRGMGELYFFQLPLIMFGLIYLIKSGKWKILGLLGWWLMIYPTGSMFTVDGGPQATRSIIGVVPWNVLSGVGLWVVLKKLGGLGSLGKLGILGLGAIGIWETVSFGQLYFGRYNLYSSDYWGWQSGPEEMIDYYLKNKSEYDSFYLDPMFNSPHIFLDFYLVDTGLRSTTDVKEPFGVPLKQRQLWGVRKDVFEKIKDSNIWTIKSVVYYPNREPAFYLLEPREQTTIEKEP